MTGGTPEKSWLLLVSTEEELLELRVCPTDSHRWAFGFSPKRKTCVFFFQTSSLSCFSNPKRPYGWSAWRACCASKRIASIPGADRHSIIAIVLRYPTASPSVSTSQPDLPPLRQNQKEGKLQPWLYGGRKKTYSLCAEGTNFHVAWLSTHWAPSRAGCKDWKWAVTGLPTSPSLILPRKTPSCV